MKKLILILFIFLLSSCASILNPYEDEFDCNSKAGKGKCSNVEKAYKSSLNNGEEEKIKPEKNISQNIYNLYKFQKLAGIIEQQNPPVVIPAEVRRVLILPYKSNNNIAYGYRYMWLFINPPEFQFTTGKEKK
ncbi:MAG: TraV family lipoprotein [Desulfobacterales bacterium]|nr:TraV family lipoprotein [Desulfobacterales bacterium]